MSATTLLLFLGGAGGGAGPTQTPAAVVLVAAPLTVQSGVVPHTQPIAWVLDTLGVLCTTGVGASAVVTATSLTPGVSVLGSQPATVNGVATYVDFAVLGPDGPASIQFASPGLTPVTLPLTISALAFRGRRFFY